MSEAPRERSLVRGDQDARRGNDHRSQGTRRQSDHRDYHDQETRGHDDHHQALRLWLRLLTCTQMIEQRIRLSLRARFAMTLPRFDLMAQLERSPKGLKMGELSQRLMVTGGNVTGLTDQLVDEGLVERRAIPNDRRAFAVRLTVKGKRTFEEMAHVHEQWVVELLSGLSETERRRLYTLLGRVKATLKEQARAKRE